MHDDRELSIDQSHQVSDESELGEGVKNQKQYLLLLISIIIKTNEMFPWYSPPFEVCL
jgi:hypothetical protein